MLVTIAAAPSVAQQTAHPHPGHDPEGAGRPSKVKFLSAAEIEALAKLVDLIIPRSDTPGARDAGVQLIIDSILSESARDAQNRFRTGLAPFTKLDNTAMLARLQELHRNRDVFFTTLKDLTIDAYYSTREGLQTELGWNGHTPLAEFKGCTHPEHKG
jgi:hypothetical protein